MVGGLSGPQERILRWLGGFSPAMEKAWDVTRHLSLPGISEALGVVRSAFGIQIVFCGYLILTPFFTCCHCFCCYVAPKQPVTLSWLLLVQADT